MLHSWDEFGVSIFSTMTEEAIRAGAINLAQGFPDFDGPKEIIEEAIVALRSASNQYAPSRGYRDLRIAISEYVGRRRGLKYDFETELSVFSGATEALFCAVMASCNKGDELLCFEPYYDIYPGLALAAGASFRGIPLKEPKWDWDLSDLEKAITPKTKVLLLNTPNNPTGKVFSREELERLSRLVIKHNLLVITDEVYEEIVFEPCQHMSIAQFPGMRERCIVISSASKTFSFTGWKVGYAMAHEKFIKRMRVIHEHTVFCSASPLQKAVTKAYQFPDSFFDELKLDYEKRKNLLLEVLEEVGFRCLKSQGTYFIVADYSRLSSLDDLDFSIWLTRTHKVACVPLSAFFEDKDLMKKKKLVRFCFAKRYETLMQSAERLRNLLKS